MPAFLPMLLTLQAASMVGVFLSGGCTLRFCIGTLMHRAPSKAWLGGGLVGVGITLAAVVALIVLGVPQVVHAFEHLPSGPLISITYSVSR